MIQILVLIILIALNAFFAASEMAFISLNDAKIEKEAKGGNKKAKQIEKSINTKINDEWKNNIISSADELNKEINNGELTIDDENYFDGLGAQISVSDAEPAKNILTFYTEVSGGFGGVGWFEYKGYNYDKTTGELLTLKTITNDYNELYKLIKHEIDKKLNE